MLRLRCEEAIEPTSDEKDKSGGGGPLSLVRRIMAEPEHAPLPRRDVPPARLKALRKLAAHHISVRIRQHSLIREKQPFVIFALEIFTAYSRQIEVKRFSSFEILQKQLLLFFSDQSCLFNYGQAGLLPSLPSGSSFNKFSQKFLTKRKDQLQKYCQQLLSMLRMLASADTSALAHWTGLQLILDFFGIHRRIWSERHYATKLQRVTRKFLSRRKEVEERRKYYRDLGYPTDLEELPQEIHLFTFGFLSLRDRCRLRRLSRYFNDTAMHPANLRDINLFPFRKYINKPAVSALLGRAKLLQSLSLKFFAHLDLQDLFTVLASTASSDHFSQLYLDGCENIDDNTLTPLSEEEPNGFAGLELLSLAECRKLSDDGLKRIAQGCPQLRVLVLLGCFGVSDGSVELALESLPLLQEIDLGGTNVSGAIIDFMTGKIEAEQLKRLRRVSLVGCKKVNSYQFPRLGRVGIEADTGEDVFRFHLVPTDGSSLQRVTNSLLKTRSTLSMHRVYRYLLKKLNLDMQQDDPTATSFVFADSVLEISCFGTVLEPDVTLKHVYERHWFGPNFDEHLTLNYRLKHREKQLGAQEMASRRQFPQQAGVWLPDHLSTGCAGCGAKFGLFLRRHHCRKCGLVFCAECSRGRAPLPEFGYLKAVRVCRKCF